MHSITLNYKQCHKRTWRIHYTFQQFFEKTTLTMAGWLKEKTIEIERIVNQYCHNGE